MSVSFGRNYGVRDNHRKLTEEERRMLISVFHAVDEHHDGSLRRGDIKVAMVYLFGYKPSKYELDKMTSKIQRGDENASEGITEEDFITMMAPKLSAVEEDDEIRQIFLAFDSQCRGFLGLDDVHKAYAQVAPHMPAHNIDTAFREIDRDGDGRVSYKDFEFMMKYSQENGF